VPELQRLRADHAAAVKAFELANRAYFAAAISDRGDDYFREFGERFRALLDAQDSGAGAFHVLVTPEPDGLVLGRFNLNLAGDGTAELGYRVARYAAGLGLATAAVTELCQLAPARYGLRLLRAAVADGNIASQKVLARAGFVLTGPADPKFIGGKAGSWYERDLTRAAAAR
jgi:ribosomal-protein-alanine N-acetyltransferase